MTRKKSKRLRRLCHDSHAQNNRLIKMIAMFHKSSAQVIIGAILVLASTLPSSSQAETSLVHQAQDIVKQFAGQLKPQLQDAMRAGGPPLAVKVCAETAPLIAESLSESTGWSVRRVSDRPRNPSAALDDWERLALSTLNARLAEPQTSALILHETTADGFRYAQAQVTEGLCLACHGTSLAPETAAMLTRYYPNDQAKGYQIGEIRGLFSLQKSAKSPL
jgi:hypothetical protein